MKIQVNLLKGFFPLIILYLLQTSVFAQTGKVGINTLTPQAMLHVKDSSVLFTGTAPLPNSPGLPAASGPGVRMMWYPNKAAFRVGRVTGNTWDKDSIGLYSFSAGYNTIAKGGMGIALGYSTAANGLYSTAFGDNTFANGSSSTAFGTNSVATGYASTAFGSNSYAYGPNSTAFGTNTTANGFSSTAFGSGTTSNGTNSTAFGANTIASGGSTAFGFNTNASGGSTAFGGGTIASGYNSTAFGVNTEAIGDYCTSFGYYTSASGIVSTAFGELTEAIGIASTASGSLTKAGGDYSTVMGWNTQSNGFSSLVIGAYNDTVVSPQTFLSSTTPLFIVGNGSTNFTRSNALIVRKDGRVGIGTNTPANILDVEGGLAVGSSYAGSFAAPANGGIIQGNLGVGTSAPARKLHVTTGSSGAPAQASAVAVFESASNTYVNIASQSDEESGILFSLPSSSSHGGIIYNNSSVLSGMVFRTNGNLTRMTITNNGNVGIGTTSPTQKLHVAGNICYTGSIAACSDARYKKDFKPLAQILPKLDEIGAFSYRWDTESFPEKDFTEDPQIGVMAQEIQSMFPELVLTDEQGFMSVDYSRLSVILLAGMKEQQALIDQQQTIIHDLLDRVSALEKDHIESHDISTR